MLVRVRRIGWVEQENGRRERGRHPRNVAPPEDTYLERISLVDPRIKDLRDLVAIESGARPRVGEDGVTACARPNGRAWPCFNRMVDQIADLIDERAVKKINE